MTPRNSATVLVAPDKFKGTFTAPQVAGALERGLAATGQKVDVRPVADGGEGTLEALTPAFALERVTITVADPLGRPVEATFGLSADGVAVVEMGSASGLALLREQERDALAASTRGTGELIVAAMSAGARRIYVAAGGSATTDGGAGALQAMRERCIDEGALRAKRVRLTVLCDVVTPFEQAARTFGAQKGADPQMVDALSQRLDSQAAGYRRDPRGVPMSGAAGGLAGGLWAELDAELVAGAARVLDAIGFDDRIRGAGAVVSGEGRLDHQTLAGKAVSAVATRARQAGVPIHLVVGINELASSDAQALGLRLILKATTLGELEAAGVEIGERLNRVHR